MLPVTCRHRRERTGDGYMVCRNDDAGNQTGATDGRWSEWPGKRNVGVGDKPA
jgi:hypothetical protein